MDTLSNPPRILNPEPLSEQAIGAHLSKVLGVDGQMECADR